MRAWLMVTYNSAGLHFYPTSCGVIRNQRRKQKNTSDPILKIRKERFLIFPLACDLVLAATITGHLTSIKHKNNFLILPLTPQGRVFQLRCIFTIRNVWVAGLRGFSLRFYAPLLSLRLFYLTRCLRTLRARGCKAASS